MSKDKVLVEEKEKCFVIMPISDQGDYPNGHFTKVYEQILKPAIQEAGYEAFRVDEDTMCEPIIGKIFKALQECPMAICDLSNRNPNVLYELGIRQAYDKPVVLIQDDKTERIFDVSGINTIPYKSLRLYEDVIEARERIKEAIISTRDGKHNSIIKVVNAQSAVISSGEMTKEERIEVMLSGLIEDVRDLKKDSRLLNGSDNNKNYSNSAASWDEFFNASYNKLAKKKLYSFSLKNGVTNTEISREIGKLEKYYGNRITFSKNNNLLYITIVDDDEVVVNEILDSLRAKFEK